VKFMKGFWDGSRWRIGLRSLYSGCAYSLSSSIGTEGGVGPFQGLQYSNSLLKCLYLLNELLNLLALGRDVLGIAYTRNK
jgi:hypothetical protein